MSHLRSHLLGAGGRYYHCVSRATGRDFLFGKGEKEAFGKLMRKVEAFSGVKVLTWTILSNHFHVLVELPDGETAAAAGEMSDKELLARIGKLYSPEHVRDVAQRLRDFSGAGMGRPKAALRDSYIRRMGDLSEFMRSLKQRFSSSYNRYHGRCGTLWEGCFKAVAVGGDVRAVLAVAAYIDLNAVRARICKDPKDYRWCGYAEAVAGVRGSRAGLAAVLEGFGESGHWSHVGHVYRKVLFGIGADKESKSGFSEGAVDEVMARDGRLRRTALLEQKVRYFTDGLAIGTRAFVEEFFQATQGTIFKSGRKTGARKMRGGDWGDFYSVRDLQKDAVPPP